MVHAQIPTPVETITPVEKLPAALFEQIAKKPADLIPLELFFQRPAVLDAKLSPSGKQLALTTSKGGNRVSLVVVSLAEGNTATRAATFSDVDITHFDWVGENRLIFNVSDLSAGSGKDRQFAPGLFGVNPDGSHLRLLVRRQDKPFFSNGESREVLDFNHTVLAVPLQQAGVKPEEVVIGKIEFSNNDIRKITPMWLNVRTGRSSEIELNAPSGAVNWLFDSKGQARVATTYVNGRAAVHWRGPDDTNWRLLTNRTISTEKFSPSAVDDAGNFYVKFDSGSEGLKVLSLFDFVRGEPQKPALVASPGFDLDGEMILDQAGGRALGVRVDADGEQTVWFDESMKRMQALADKTLPGHVNRLSCRRCGADDMVVLVRSFSDRNPGRLYLYEAALKRWQPVINVLEGINPERMATVDFQRIKARDGRDLPVWLTLPAETKPGQPLPAVVLVHGGPWLRIGHWRWEPMEQFLASRGYLVISPEFRGSTGYGDAHFKAGWKQWGQSMQDDVADALLWAQKQGLASNKACIAGASYGGYSSLMGLVRHPQLYRCGIAWVAVTDPFLLINGAWWLNDDISASGRRNDLPLRVGDVEKDASMLIANSPLAQASKIKAPLLMAFGESDERVPLIHGQRMRTELQDAGHPPEWVTYVNEGHNWRQVSTHIDFARRVEKFLDQHLNTQQP